MESGRQGPMVRGHARAVLPEGVVTPAVHGPNLADAPAVARALEGVLAELPRRPRRVALLLPDGAAKVSMVRFANVPARAADLDRMIRWQVRRTVPFSVDEAQMDWTPGRLTAGGEQEFVVVLAHRAVVEDYERVCAAAGGACRPGRSAELQPDRRGAGGRRGVGGDGARLAARARGGRFQHPGGPAGPGPPAVQDRRRGRAAAGRHGASDGDVLRGSHRGRQPFSRADRRGRRGRRTTPKASGGSSRIGSRLPSSRSRSGWRR